jgi:hypothetical protein
MGCFPGQATIRVPASLDGMHGPFGGAGRIDTGLRRAPPTGSCVACDAGARAESRVLDVRREFGLVGGVQPGLHWVRGAHPSFAS